MQKKIQGGKQIIFIILLSFVSSGHALTLQQQRQHFRLAETQLKKKQQVDFDQLSQDLHNYPLLPYLEYLWLRNNLHQHQAIESYLIAHKDSRYAPRLKNKWLRQVAKDKNWEQLIKHYRDASSADLKCLYHIAQYNSGQTKQALVAAKKLWTVGHSQPNVCNPLFKQLINSSYFTRDMVWQRFQAALNNGKTSLAKYIHKLMGPKDKKVAELWLKVHDNPFYVKNKANWHQNVKQAGLIFAHAIKRIARTNSVKAAAIWDPNHQKYTIPTAIKKQIERKLAIGFAFRRQPSAYQRLDQLQTTDKTIREWQIRAALINQDWPLVQKSLDKLTPSEKKQNKWKYWQARTLEAQGQAKKANLIFQQLAQDRSFYGFMSAYKLEQTIRLGDQPLAIAEQAIDKLSQTDDFRSVEEWLALDRMHEAKTQWWHTVKKLNKNEILTAAKLAHRWKLDQIAIFTVARAKYWNDISLRFPIKFQQQIRKNAAQRKLDPAIILGIIRRESAFDAYAQSPVGARGLMQIMPNTGKQIARDLKEKWRSTKSLYNPNLNVKYGAFYYKQLLDEFNGHYALAAAAYNAGPHRVRRWLPDDKPVPADIWIETIPFKETRGYVNAVLAYALIYQKRLKTNALTMNEFMRKIIPG